MPLPYTNMGYFHFLTTYFMKKHASKILLVLYRHVHLIPHRRL